MNANSSTTVSSWLASAGTTLKDAGIATARLDTLVLLEDATGKDRGWLLAHPEENIPDSQLRSLNARIKHRASHVPLAYIRGKAEFYGREFTVNAHTLVPRPETEAMIDTLKYVSRLESDLTSWEDGNRRHVSKRGRRPTGMTPPSSLVRTPEGYKIVWGELPKRQAKTSAPEAEPVHLNPNDHTFRLIDVGTGSGAIAITAKLELPQAKVVATDIDEKCLETAKGNAKKLGAEILFVHGNLLEPLDMDASPITALLCNLPYVPDNFQINTAATHEPRHALFGGADGLDVYRELFKQIQTNAWAPDYVLAESLPPQHEVLANVAKAAGYDLRRTKDFIQLFVAR